MRQTQLIFSALICANANAAADTQGAVVAVVGQGHVPGIQRLFGRTTNAQCDALQPPPDRTVLFWRSSL